MSVSSTESKVIYTGSGTTGPFDFDFKVYASSDLFVQRLTISSGDLTTFAETTDYVVTIGGDGTGSITLVASLSSLYKLIISRVLPITQEIAYVEGDKFPSASHEEGLDRGVMIDQQLQEQLDRVVLQSPDQTTPINLPSPADGYVIGWDGTGGDMKNVLVDSGLIATAVASASASASSASTSASTATTKAAEAAASAVDAAASAASITSGLYFRAVSSGAQSGIATATYTKMTLGTETFDPSGYFASSKFTPLTAGKYYFTGNVSMGLVPDRGLVRVVLYKNGSSSSSNDVYASNAGTGDCSAVVSDIIDMNGTTDYVELYVYQSSGGSLSSNYATLCGFKLI